MNEYVPMNHPTPWWIMMKISGTWSIGNWHWWFQRGIWCCWIKFFPLQFQLLEFCLRCVFDDLSSFDRLARLASFSFRYLARSSSKLSFGFLPLYSQRSLPLLILERFDFNFSESPWSEPIWPVEQTSLTCFANTAGVISSCSDCEYLSCPQCPLEFH